MIEPTGKFSAPHAYHARGDDAQAELMRERQPRSAQKSVQSRLPGVSEARSPCFSDAINQMCLATAVRAQVLLEESRARLPTRGVPREPIVFKHETDNNNTYTEGRQNASPLAADSRVSGVSARPSMQEHEPSLNPQHAARLRSITPAINTQLPLSTGCEKFIERGARDAIETLNSNGTIRICQRCLDSSLILAVRLGSHRMALRQLSKGADPDSAGGIALLEAMRARHAALVLSLVSDGANKPSSSTVDKALGIIYKEVGSQDYFLAEQDIVKTCLRAAPRGYAARQTLGLAIKHQCLDVIEILTYCQEPISSDYCTFLGSAIMTQEPRVLEAVLKSRPSSETLALVAAQAFESRDPEIMSKMLRLLVGAGLRGAIMTETLTWTLEHLRRVSPNSADHADIYCDLIQFLVDKGAGVAALDDESLVWCVQLSDPELRLRLIYSLLRAGACGPGVGEALSLSAALGECGLSLTSTLLQRSSVNFNDGKPLLNAVSSCCIGQLKLLLDAGPSWNTLYRGWNQVMRVEDHIFRLEAIELLISCRKEALFLDEALVKAVALKDKGLPICSLLLQHGASAERSRCQAILAAAKHKNLSALELFQSRRPNQALYTDAFEALVVDDSWLTDTGLGVANFLLDHGATGRPVETGFCSAARCGDANAFELLLETDSITSETREEAFVQMTNGSMWLSPSMSYLEICDSLLRSGVSAEATNNAFLTAVSGMAEGRGGCEDILKSLAMVGRGVDVNYRDAEALRTAVRFGNEKLFTVLVSQPDVTPRSRILAVSEAILAPLEEEVVLQLINAATKNIETLPGLEERGQWRGLAPIVACMKSHPTSAKLVKRLAQLGCNMEAETPTIVYEDVGEELVSPLLWALSQSGECQIPSATIMALIRLGEVNVDTKAPKSYATALILALKNGRDDLVGKLVKRGANVSNRDCFDRSALFYASGAGKLAAVKAIQKSTGLLLPNDGSLHEAARNLHSQVVQCLLKNGHDPSFRSSNSKHEGRDALQELALKTQASEENFSELSEIIYLLICSNPGQFLETPGKNALFMALDNPQPCTVTRAFLDVVAWDCINHEKNTFQEYNTGFFFSPTVYIKRGLCASHQRYRRRLLQLLEGKDCMDRLYAERGAPQPLDAVGIPKEIEHDMRKAQKARDKMEKEAQKARDEAERKEKDHENRKERQMELQEMRRREKERVHRMQERWRHGMRLAGAAWNVVSLVGGRI